MVKTLSLFGLRIADADRITAIAALLDRPGRTTAAFVNAHCVNVAARDTAYKRALRAADFLLPDGSGMALAARMAGRRLDHNLNGTDLSHPLCREAARRGLSIYLLGARPGIAREAARKLTLAVPGLRIAGTRDGFFDEADSDAVIARINESGADIVLVAMGVPMQESWLYRHRRQLDARLAMGVGALFDFEAGVVPRAPGSLRRAGLEWTWRLAVEPRRMFRRYVLGNPAFVWRAARNALRTPRPRSDAMPWTKRLLDLTVASAALVALSPVLIGTALAVRLTSRGPVLFRQERVGLDGERFTMLKFRSMHVDAEARRAALLGQSEREGVCFKMRDDPRLTPVGGLIRRYSLDELPQLWNVIRGDMSLVGPRPALPEEVAAYPIGALRRLRAVPGITGIWQVSGRAEIAFGRMVAMDLAYIRSRSVLLDMLLLALTARAVLAGRGAY
ncbi:WecB/TagA/CpsF family glycosyltransferase [Roseobacter sp. HKCCA0434]|uniref:WecB/TagA/CpsF family glycosyltransferase n=1 Tax=Roseobacter sp. HKCCA0434 TaxID=3079297 RepID=UPI002905E837|nr:WecB/TagA/CpsF family glycosyltransferase [Roseobacter sp. HKCCA0434]